MIKIIRVRVGRAVARILVRRGVKIMGRGQARPERPRAGVGFFGWGSQPSPHQLGGLG